MSYTSPTWHPLDPLAYKEEEDIDLNPQVPMGISSSSPDEAVTSSSPSALDDHRQYQRTASDLQISLEEVQNCQYLLLDILISKQGGTLS